MQAHILSPGNAPVAVSHIGFRRNMSRPRPASALAAELLEIPAAADLLLCYPGLLVYGRAGEVDAPVLVITNLPA